jgi:Transposase DDE domain
LNLEPRLKRRYEKLVMAHSNSTTSLSAGVKALGDEAKAFSHTQALWRFLNNEEVTPLRLSEPLVAGCHAVMTQEEGDYALCVHDWSRIQYGKHSSKKDRLQMTHAKDIGYELQSSLLVSAENGLPLSVVVQNLVSAQGIWQSRKASIQPDDQTHLDELSERMDWIERQGLSKRLVHLVDREADSVDHLRRWSRQGYDWLVRVKAGSKVRCGKDDMSLEELAQQLSFRQTRQVLCKGQSCTQWIAGTQVILARKAKPKRLDGNGQRVKTVAGEALTVRLTVSRIVNEDGDEVAQWYLLSNVPDHIEDAQLAQWYYWRWEIESFFKLLKSAGHQLESWEQETARALFNRILIATQACVMAWQLMRAQNEEAIQARLFLVRLSGRQMKRARPVTFPALLDGLFTLFTMLETLEHYSIAELKNFAHIAKNALNL